MAGETFESKYGIHKFGENIFVENKFGENITIISGYTKTYNEIMGFDPDSTDDVHLLTQKFNKAATFVNHVNSSIQTYQKDIPKCDNLKLLLAEIKKASDNIPDQIATCKSKLEEGIKVGDTIPGKTSIDEGAKKFDEMVELTASLLTMTESKIEETTNTIKELEKMEQDVEYKKKMIGFKIKEVA